MVKVLIAVVLLAVSAQAALPTFKNKGSPPDVSGAWTGTFNGLYAVGLLSNGTLMASLSDPTGGKYTFSGKYLNHECTGKGKYRAIVADVFTLPDGNQLKTTVCEVGEIDLGKGTWTWSTNEKECPTKFNIKMTRLNSWGAAKEYTCK